MGSGLLMILYVAVALLPLGLAWSQGAPPRSVADELASGAGLLALAIILVEFVMSGRFRTISRRIGSDVTMRMHQLLARSALGLAMAHPFLYRGPTGHAPDWDISRAQSITWDFTAIWPGIVAFALFPALVLLALGRTKLDFRYETWRAMHGIGAVLIAGTGVLHATRAGRYSADPLLGGLWWGMLGVAVASLLFVYVARPLMRWRQPWTVTRIAPAADRMWEVTLTPARPFAWRYQAGQFAWLNIGHSPFSFHENPFSIATAPAQGPGIGFVIKELGDFTGTIGRITPGSRAYVDGPHGHLSPAGHPAPGFALIAGGVGIAPMLGILRELAATGDPRPTTLIYGNRTAGQIVNPDELAALARDHGTQVVHVLSEPAPDWDGEAGIISRDLLQRHLGQDHQRDWLYLLCGPPPMLEGVEASLLAMGIPAQNILSERFVYD